MRWIKLEPIIQSEISQKEKHQSTLLRHICTCIGGCGYRGGHARGAGLAQREGSHMARVLVWVSVSLSLELSNLPLEPTPHGLSTSQCQVMTG